MLNRQNFDRRKRAESFPFYKMKKWSGVVVVALASLFMFLVLTYGLMKICVGDFFFEAPFSSNAATTRLELMHSALPPPVVQNSSQVISNDAVVFNLFAPRNLSNEEQKSLQTWYHLRNLIDHAHIFPNGVESIKEAESAWSSLMASVDDEERPGNADESGAEEKQCPHFLNKMDVVTELDNTTNGYKLELPCGLTQGSSISITGIPDGDFRIDLTGESLPGEPNTPVILHYDVRLQGDKITEDPVIVQNTWTVAHDWSEEERCPSPVPEKNKKVDELDQCNKMVGRNDTLSESLRRSSKLHDVTRYFPFKQGYPSVATFRVGSEGIQMTVDGEHITSFAFRETLLVSEVRISGDLKLVSVLASGLPTSEHSEHHAIDLEELKPPPFHPEKPLDLFVGVLSSANNFKRRMAVRRTWMQYPSVRSGGAAVRFFVGLNKNEMVNEQLWNEARTYGDIQLMPFVDYYSVTTWKTLAICIYGTQFVASAKYVMKTDDDSFVRVDQVLVSLKRINRSHGLVYGRIRSDSHPLRNPESKWYVSHEEWPEEAFPTLALGPGYVVSRDIAKAVYERYLGGHLKMFRIEDISMAIWIDGLKKEGLAVKHEMEEKVYITGCRDGYIVAHYQGPREMLCLWQKLQDGNRAECCSDRD